MIESERWETDRRYYQLLLAQDLLGDWLLTRSWGAKQSRRQGSRKDLICDQHSAMIKVRKLRTRRRAHGYRPISNLLDSGHPTTPTR